MKTPNIKVPYKIRKDVETQQCISSFYCEVILQIRTEVI